MEIDTYRNPYLILKSILWYTIRYMILWYNDTTVHTSSTIFYYFKEFIILIVYNILKVWKGSFVGRKRKKVWKSILLFIFWTIWKERNRLAFKGGVLAFQKLKTSFVYNFWGWAKLYIDMESNSLIGFLEWLASK